MKKTYIVAAVVCALAACTPVLPEEGGDITLTGGSKNMTAYADETSVDGGNGLSFTTVGAWYAEVEEVASRAAEEGAADWISLNPSSGDAAGDYTVDIVLTVNETGADRTAVIRIVCGESILSVNVTQKGTAAGGGDNDGDDDEGGETPPAPAVERYVSGIVGEAYLGSGYPEDTDWEPRRVWTFRYDEQNRVAEYAVEIAWDESDDDSKNLLTVTCDYGSEGEVRVSERDEYGDVEEYTVFLGDNGYVERMEAATDESGDAKTYFMEYDGDGRLAEINWQLDEWSKYSWRYDYVGGVLSSIEHLTSVGGWETEDGLDDLFGNIANDRRCNLDLNSLFLSLCESSDSVDPNYRYDDDMPGRVDMLGLLRLLGSGSDYYVAEGLHDELASADAHGEYHEPNVTIPVSYESVSEEWNPELVYVQDGQGYVSTITQTCTFVRTRIAYDIVVGDQLIDPELPELGYVWTIENRSTTELGRGTNEYVYTVSYR